MISFVSKRKEHGLQEDCDSPVIYSLVGSFLLFPASALLVLQSRGKGFVYTPKGSPSAGGSHVRRAGRIETAGR